MKNVPATRIALLLLVLVAIAGVLFYAWPTTTPEPPARVAMSPAPKPKPAPAPATAAVETLKNITKEIAPQPERKNDAPPSFDVARIEPNGDAVIGGRAAPGATVELLRGGVPHDKTVADRSGDFVLVPKRLPPGDYDLTLRATDSDGKVLTSKDSVAVSLRAGDEEKPVVALVAPDKPAVVLSKPTTDTTAKLAIDAVESEAGGKLYVSGRAAPGAKVHLYLNDAYIASATASAEGRVAFSIQSGIKPGDYRVRLDQVDASDHVQQRAEVPFKAPVMVASSASPGTPTPASDATAHNTATASTNPAPAAASPPATVPEPQPAPPESTPPPAATAAPPATPKPAAPQAPPAPRENASAPAGQPPSPPPAESKVASSPPPAPAEPKADSSAPPPAASKAASPPPEPAAPKVASSPPPATADVTPPVAVTPDKGKHVVVVPSISTRVVVRGDSLWRISRSTYGRGARYSVIYKANRDQIRDPDLIYPGQIFVLPRKRE